MKISFETFKKVTGHDFIFKKIACEFSGVNEHITISFRMLLNAEVI